MDKRNSRQYPTGIRAADAGIEIWFTPKNTPRRYERLPWPATPANLEKAARLRKKITDAIRHGTFVYADFFPDSPHAGPKPAEQIFAALAQSWLDDPRNDWKPQSRKKFKSILERIWMPSLHHMDIGKISHTNLIDALKQAITHHKKRYNGEPSKSTYNDWLTPIRGVFELAIRIKAIDKHQNPCDDFENKKRDKKLVDPFDMDEAELIISKISELYGPVWQSWFEIGFFSGIRYPSEINPLLWSDIDFRKREMRIDKTWTPSGTHDTTKTGKDRVVHLNSRALEAFQRVKKVTGLIEGPIFVAEDGEPVHSANTQRKMWQRALRELGIRHRKMYNMRHSYATFGLMHGVNPAYLAHQLGHSTEVFFSTYATWINRNQNTLQIELMERAIVGLKTENVGKVWGFETQET